MPLHTIEFGEFTSTKKGAEVLKKYQEELGG